MSALPPKADMFSIEKDVCFVPIADTKSLPNAHPETLSVLKARTLSSGVTSTWSRRPVWRCLELVSLADYKGLGLPQLTPKN